MVFLSPDSNVYLIGSEEVCNPVGYCLDNQCDVVFLGLTKFGVEKVDFVALRFFVSKRVTRLEDWMTVVGVNILATGVVSSDGL